MDPLLRLLFQDQYFKIMGILEVQMTMIRREDGLPEYVTLDTTDSQLSTFADVKD